MMDYPDISLSINIGQKLAEKEPLGSNGMRTAILKMERVGVVSKGILVVPILTLDQ